MMMLRTRANPTAPGETGGEPEPPPPHPVNANKQLSKHGAVDHLAVLLQFAPDAATIERKADALERIHMRLNLLLGISILIVQTGDLAFSLAELRKEWCGLCISGLRRYSASRLQCIRSVSDV